MAPEQSKGATKGVRVINCVVNVFCVLKSNFFRP